MATLKVTGLNDELYKALRTRAAMDNRSVSQEVVTMIQEFLSSPKPDAREATRAFLELAGSWEDDRSAKELARDLRKARRSGRRIGKNRTKTIRKS